MREVTLVPPRFVTLLSGVERVTKWKSTVTVHYSDGRRRCAKLPDIQLSDDADVCAIANRVEQAQRAPT